jgi:hypothetical protein
VLMISWDLYPVLGCRSVFRSDRRIGDGVDRIHPSKYVDL